jgi:hypothetical protein
MTFRASARIANVLNLWIYYFIKNYLISRIETNSDLVLEATSRTANVIKFILDFTSPEF